MKNIPKRIFIQIGDFPSEDVELSNYSIELEDVTFSVERIFDSDIEYVLKEDISDFYCEWESEGYPEKCTKQCSACNRAFD